MEDGWESVAVDGLNGEGGSLGHFREQNSQNILNLSGLLLIIDNEGRFLVFIPLRLHVGLRQGRHQCIPGRPSDENIYRKKAFPFKAIEVFSESASWVLPIQENANTPPCRGCCGGKLSKKSTAGGNGIREASM